MRCYAAAWVLDGVCCVGWHVVCQLVVRGGAPSVLVYACGRAMSAPPPRRLLDTYGCSVCTFLSTDLPGGGGGGGCRYTTAGARVWDVKRVGAQGWAACGCGATSACRLPGTSPGRTCLSWFARLCSSGGVLCARVQQQQQVGFQAASYGWCAALSLRMRDFSAVVVAAGVQGRVVG